MAVIEASPFWRLVDFAEGLPDDTIEHGTTAGYRHSRCRCLPCRAADARAKSERYAKRRKRETEQLLRREAA